MRRKDLSWITLTFIISIATLAVAVGPASVNSSTTTVSVEPPTTTVAAINETFVINITVSSVTDLFGWQAGMTFNPDVLECLSFVEGPFLKTGGTTLWAPGSIDNTNGIIYPYGATLTGAGTPVSGNGTLAYVTFKVKAYGAPPYISAPTQWKKT